MYVGAHPYLRGHLCNIIVINTKYYQLVDTVTNYYNTQFKNHITLTY